MKALIEETKIKVLMKEAVGEVFKEKRKMFHDLVVEAIEDMALINAINRGEKTDSVSRSDIFKILKS